jgi:hypothetical protein
MDDTGLRSLLDGLIGAHRSARLLAILELPHASPSAGAEVPRADIAFGLGALLFDGLLARVPEGAAYVERQRRLGGKVSFDHGALRTVDSPRTGALPPGHLAFRRLLEPLGYREAGLYPLPRLRMTGRAFTHEDDPEGLPQFFVSELHVSAFGEEFQEAAGNVTQDSEDPLPPIAAARLQRLARNGALALPEAMALLADLLPCFDRQHPIPRLADYEALLLQSAEMAWIATEGNAFNHATDRVADVHALAQALNAEGFAMKDAVEKSRNGRIFQTATRATSVLRPFRGDAGRLIIRSVPGSFYEFISRRSLPDGRLDLTFDSGNATAIFAMTAPTAGS